MSAYRLMSGIATSILRLRWQVKANTIDSSQNPMQMYTPGRWARSRVLKTGSALWRTVQLIPPSSSFSVHLLRGSLPSLDDY